MTSLLSTICYDLRARVKYNLPNHNATYTNLLVDVDVWVNANHAIRNCVKLTVQVPTHGFILNDRNER